MRAGGRDARRIPIARIDRLWRESMVVTAVGEVVVPDRAATVSALVALGSAGPDARVGLRFAEGSTRHWLYDPDGLAEYAETCVVQLDPGADDDLDELMSSLAAQYQCDRPLRVFLADRHVLCLTSHALGDSRLVIALPGAIVAQAHNGTLPPTTRAVTEPHPLRAALRHTFSSRARIAAMFAERRAARGTSLEHPVDLDRTGERTFCPEPVSVSVPSPSGSSRAVRSWTARNLPGAAHFATVLTMAEQSLTEHGIACEPGVHMMFDLRRYLPRGRRTTGNFIGGLNLLAPVHDPRALTGTVTRAAKSGRPLAAILAAVVLSELRRIPGIRARRHTLVPAAPRARLALSYVLPTRVDTDLPWLGDPDTRMCWCRVEPASPTAITLLVGMIGARMQLSASFHATVFDAAAVRAALQAVHDDPIGLLQRAGLRESAGRTSSA